MHVRMFAAVREREGARGIWPMCVMRARTALLALTWGKGFVEGSPAPEGGGLKGSLRGRGGGRQGASTEPGTRARERRGETLRKNSSSARTCRQAPSSAEARKCVCIVCIDGLSESRRGTAPGQTRRVGNGAPRHRTPTGQSRPARHCTRGAPTRSKGLPHPRDEGQTHRARPRACPTQRGFR